MVWHLLPASDRELFGLRAAIARRFFEPGQMR